MTAADPLSDALADAAAADLDAAFGKIVEEYGPAVFTTAVRVGGRAFDAEDLAAETFARAYAALLRYPPERIRGLRLRPWLVTITLNLWRNEVRTASRRPSLVGLDAVDRVVGDARAGPAAAIDPAEQVAGTDGDALLSELLARLPESQRVPVVLRHVVGLTYEEIGEATGRPVGTVKAATSRGLAFLRRRLVDAGAPADSQEDQK